MIFVVGGVCLWLSGYPVWFIFPASTLFTQSLHALLVHGFLWALQFPPQSKVIHCMLLNELCVNRCMCIVPCDGLASCPGCPLPCAPGIESKLPLTQCRIIVQKSDGWMDEWNG